MTVTTPPAPPTDHTHNPLRLLCDHARLPGAEHLLDPARLSALLGREVTADRVRIKPDASVLIAHRPAGPGPAVANPVGPTTPGSNDAGPAVPAPAAAPAVGATAAGATRPDLPGCALDEAGWVLLVASRDKRDNILRRAARCGSEVREHRVAHGADPDRGPFLLSGDMLGDPRLGGEIHRVLRRRSSAGTPRVLSYNPGRHALLLLPGTGEVLRVASRPLDALLQVTDCWRALDLPALEQRRWRHRRAVLVAEHWGRGDLAALAAHPRSMPAATRLGGIMARLHAADVSTHDLPAARIGAPIPETLTALTDLLPEHGARLARLAERLRAALAVDTPPVLIHGDLSPDQVLVSVDEAVPAGQGRLPLRVVDLDRSGLGPAEADLGAWLAACLLAGVEEQATAFLDGYARQRPLPAPEQLAAWTARAVLAAALDPMRRGAADWLPQVTRRLALAEAVLERPHRLPLPVAPRAATPTESRAAQRSPIPAEVEHRGARLRVRRAWADDGRGLPLELADETSRAPLRAGRLDPATGEVTVFETGTDPRLPGLARVLAAHPGAVVVSHRPGKRAVVRTRDDHGAVRFVKIVRPGRAARLLEAITRAEDFAGPFRTAPVLAADEDTVTFAELPGRLLHDGLPLADGTWQRAWRETLEAWSAAVDASRSRPAAATGGEGAEPAPGQVHGPAAEAAVLSTWCERAGAVDPAGARTRGRAVAAAQRELARLGDVTHPALIHRDLHDKQILWCEGEAPALLDVDTATLGDPALDAGNLRAHAAWRELQGLWSAEQAAVVRQEIDRAAAASDLRPEALAAYESATIARLACVYAFRPQWRTAAQQLAATLDPAGHDAADDPVPHDLAPDSSPHDPTPHDPAPEPFPHDPTPHDPTSPLGRSISR